MSERACQGKIYSGADSNLTKKTQVREKLSSSSVLCGSRFNGTSAARSNRRFLACPLSVDLSNDNILRGPLNSAHYCLSQGSFPLREKDRACPGPDPGMRGVLQLFSPHPSSPLSDGEGKKRCALFRGRVSNRLSTVSLF